jgi:aromatic ring-opening dioxygenase catalytic subunit (LigB family)
MSSAQHNQKLNKFGFTRVAWRAAKNEVRAILIECAKRRRFITYSQLAPQIVAVSVEYHDPRLNALLGQVATEEEQRGRGLLSVLVVHKLGDMQPGPGFYKLAEWFGRKIPDMTRFWVDEFNSVFDYWQQHPNENP